MVDMLHKRLKENAQKLLLLKGNIKCPATHLNKEDGDLTISCLHVCGVMFPQWKDATAFIENGAKSTIDNCPCNSPLTLIISEEWVRVKDVFWAYVDKVLTTDKSNLPP